MNSSRGKLSLRSNKDKVPTLKVATTPSPSEASLSLSDAGSVASSVRSHYSLSPHTVDGSSSSRLAKSLNNVDGFSSSRLAKSQNIIDGSTSSRLAKSQNNVEGSTSSRLTKSQRNVAPEQNEQLYSSDQQLLDAKDKINYAYLNTISKKHLAYIMKTLNTSTANTIKENPRKLVILNNFDSFDKKNATGIDFDYTTNDHILATIANEGKINNYLLDFNKVLGNGADGKVILGYKLEKNLKNWKEAAVAVKISHKTIKKETIAERVEALTTYDQYLDHCELKSGKDSKPCFMMQYENDSIEFTDYMYAFDSNMKTQEEKEKPEYVKGKRYIKPENQIKIFQNLIMGVDAFHGKLHVHTDLKSDNLLLNKKLSLTIIDLDFATKNPERFIHNNVGTWGHVDPEIISPHYILKPMSSTLPEKNEIQVEIKPDGLWYKTSLSEGVKLINKENFESKAKGNKFPSLSKDITEIEKYKSNILTIIAKRGHAGTVCSFTSDWFSAGVIGANLVSDMNFESKRRELAIKKAERKNAIDDEIDTLIKNKLKRELQKHKDKDEDGKDEIERKIRNEFDTKRIQMKEEESLDFVTYEDLYNKMPDIFNDEFLWERLERDGILESWLSLDVQVLFSKYIEPSLKGVYLDEDIEKLRNNPTDIIKEFVRRIYIVPQMARICVGLTNNGERLNGPDVANKLNVENNLLNKFTSLCEKYLTAYDFIRKQFPINLPLQEVLPKRSEINAIRKPLETIKDEPSLDKSKKHHKPHIKRLISNERDREKATANTTLQASNSGKEILKVSGGGLEIERRSSGFKLFDDGILKVKRVNKTLCVETSKLQHNTSFTG